MKIGFTADIHIKLGQKDVPVEWSKRRYNMLWEALASYNSQVDAWVIGGDTFDKVPSMDELEVFYDFLDLFKKPTYIISGNHESVKKSTTFLTNIKKASNKLNPLVAIIDDFAEILDCVDVIPYNKLKEYHPADVDFHNDILVTHVRGEIPPHVKPEVPLQLFDRWKVVLAGDLHSYENSQRNILYPGSPVTTSFHRSNVSTGFIILDTDDLSHSWIKLNLPQLIRKTVKAGDPMPAGTFDHVIYDVEGDMAALGAVADSELVGRKVVKRNVDTALILDPSMSLDQEVREYLEYIQALDEQTIETVMKEFSSHVAKLQLQ